ncbi:AraC family ligand binding domain-containing protein [Streptomyces sp. LHD-70]|uniref:AraC family transcriptional regulator n=1 Tax=Streptomyces sp. LHD-70 TaxID=3072140 RepID=UPI0035BE83CA
MHAHDTYSFGVTDDGAQSFVCRGERHVSAAGLVMTFNPDEPHDGRTAGLLALSRDAATRPARLPDLRGRVDLAAMARARSLLRQWFADNVGADELARVAGCSRFSLYRGFRAAYGFAPSDYQRDLRLRRARALLADPGTPALHSEGPRHAGTGLGGRGRPRTGEGLPGARGQPPTGGRAQPCGAGNCQG